MVSRTIDNTDLQVSPLGMGTGSLHHLRSDAQCQRLLHGALDAGLTHFDTAPVYGYGLCETRLGRFLRGHRDQVTVTSKIGMYSPGWTPCGHLGVLARKAAGKVLPAASRPRVDWSLQRAKASVQQSLARLQTDYLDCLMLHEPHPAAVPADAFLPWLESLREAGVIRAWGVAGQATPYANFITGNSPLAQVIQTHDGINGGDGDIQLSAGRRLQFTYGYLRDAGPDFDMVELLRAALTRNGTGCVLVSTRREDRIAQFAQAMHEGVA